MQDHAVPDTEADDPIELYLPLVEEELFWPVDEEEEQQQQESYSAYESVNAVGDHHLADANESLPLGQGESEQHHDLDSIVNECVRAIDELCVFSDQLKMKIEALEQKMTEAEENFNEDRDK